MGIQLTDFHRQMIKVVAGFRHDSIPTGGYLFGYLTARVEQYLQGVISHEQLADDSAWIELLRTLDARCSTAELLEIACGIRDLPGEDVPSGR